MDNTPVEQLTFVNLRSEDKKPPASDSKSFNVFEDDIRESIGWQLGF
jgi:hypothetical protein